ncbi:hypothetical protein NKG94_10085 [Micromonospora sp. M12]
MTSPENLAMLGLLLSRGFVVRTIVPDYFGPGRDRYYCQHKSRVEYVDADERYLIPVAASAQIATLLAGEQNVITGLVNLPAGPALELSRFEKDDFAALQSDERRRDRLLQRHPGLDRVRARPVVHLRGLSRRGTGAADVLGPGHHRVADHLCQHLR